MAENAGSARPPAPRAKGGFGPRLASALVMIPLALAAVWLGGLWMALLVALAAGLMVWEWGRLVGRLASQADCILFIAIGSASVLASHFAGSEVAMLVALAGILLQWALGRGRDRTPVWTALGIAWIVAPSIGFLWLRDDRNLGLPLTVWLLTLVWATDICAYVVGKSVGGPKLVPRISPNKTWSGLIGGIGGALLTGLAAGMMLPGIDLWMIIALSGGLAVVEQIGDIAESLAKRRFGVKDSSSLIPGHGGLLDRLDGMLAVVVVTVLIHIVTGGNVLKWHQA
ncbi:MAG TPA: phosphatidate cytidylyltransferase [Aliidongia sp.]|nr:phosphatidate cytidylyltransferase [Aliidongia sp.]